MSDYLILSRDIPVAKWENNQLTVLNEQLLPLYLKRVKNADMWLATRAIDSHRANSRLLKKALRLTERDDVSTVLHVNGATITDNYWIKPIDSALTYAQIKFDNDYFSRLALKGNYDSFNRAANSKHSKTPELTNIGSFEKCWKLIDRKWWMYKKASHNEQFSELFVYELGRKLGFNMARYERGEGCVKSLDFTDGAEVNFEPAMAFMGDDEEYEDVIAKLKEICPQAIPDYIRMIFMDTITANPDRHTSNFGLLRDATTGKLIGLAPMFDHNMALIARGYPSKPKSGDLLISLFNDVMAFHPEYRKYLPELTEDVVRGVIDKLGMKVRTQTVVDLVMVRYRLVAGAKE